MNKRYLDKKKDSENDIKPDFAKIKSECPFIGHCVRNVANLSRQEFHALLSISSQCNDGLKISREISEQYPGCNETKTSKLIKNAIEDATESYSCKYISKEIADAADKKMGKESGDIPNNYCRMCAKYGNVTTPLYLGVDSTDRLYKEELEELNSEYAIVNIQGKVVVMKEVIDPVSNHPDVIFLSVANFNHLFANKFVTIRKGKGCALISELWFRSRLRREYDGLIFSPKKNIEGYYNLYRGFSTEPHKGKWNLYKEHIYEVISNGNQKIFDYIIAWLADLFQNPGGKRPGIAIILRGGQGTGKGVFASGIGDTIGRHYLQITNVEYLTGRFNVHLKDKLLVYCDEAIWSGDRKAEGKLKGLITENQIVIEPKNVNAFSIKNHVRLIVASNNDWVVPAGMDERRMFVLDVSNKRAKDYEYFRTIVDQMDNGGREAMLYDLLRYDMSGVNLRKFPRTEALFDQMERSMSTVQRFWLNRLKRQKLSDGNTIKGNFVPTEALHKEFLEFSKMIGVRSGEESNRFIKQLKVLCPEMRKERKRLGISERINGYCFPSLKTCRKLFEDKVGMKINWNDDSDG